MKLLKFIIVITAVVLCFSCSNGSTSRSFYMGFTPWPYAATAQAITDTYSFINTEGDMVAHHFQQGIPFTASDTLDFNTFDPAVQNEINDRISKTAPGKVIYLAIDSLNGARDDLADLWESDSNMLRPAPWDTRSFDDPEVITAYVEFSIAVIEKFRTEYGTLPEYFNYATEISELMINEPAKFDEFVPFAQTVYSSIKAVYPSIKMMVSIALKTPGSTEMLAAKAGFARIKNYVDVVGISTYGYAFYSHPDKGNPDNLPSDWLTQIKTIAPDKPYGVTETGWIAQNLSIPAYSLNVSGSEAFQEEYLKKLFRECNNEINAEMIIWFTSHDYDTLWTDTLGRDDLSKIWKDTGMISETFAERSSLETWKSWLGRDM